jgi:histidine triad (HIT) family protein
MNKNECVFCGLIRSNNVEYEYLLIGQPGVVRVKPLNPVVPGHLLFIPIPHVEVDDGLAPEALGSAFFIAHSYARGVWDSFNLIQSNGPDSTQTIPHLHVHVVPRTRNDGLHLPWAGQVT